MTGFTNIQQPTQQGYYPQMQTAQGYSTYPMQHNYAQYPQPYVQAPQVVQQPGQMAPSAVNINIYNPTATSGTTPVAVPYYPQASLYNNYAPPADYPANYNNNINTSSKAVSNEPLNAAPAPAAPEPAKTDEKKDDKKEEKKTKVLLTDDYIKSLENYFNSEDSKIRLTASKELLERFKEDETRRTDIALTALLNKALQDTSPTVRFVALTALDVGYAAGDAQTAEILKQIQQLPDSYGEDALLASQVLLKMSGQRVPA